MDIPTELWIKIIRYVDISCIYSIMNVNDYLYEVSNDWQIWCNISIDEISANKLYELVSRDYFQLHQPDISIDTNIYKNYFKYILINNIHIPDKLYKCCGNLHFHAHIT